MELEESSDRRAQRFVQSLFRGKGQCHQLWPGEADYPVPSNSHLPSIGKDEFFDLVGDVVAHDRLVIDSDRYSFRMGCDERSRERIRMTDATSNSSRPHRRAVFADSEFRCSSPNIRSRPSRAIAT